MIVNLGYLNEIDIDLNDSLWRIHILETRI